MWVQATGTSAGISAYVWPPAGTAAPGSGPTWGWSNTTARAQSERTIADKERELQRLQEDIELEYNQRRDELLARASEKIQVIINEYAKLNGFGAIFLRNEGQTYVDLLLDITQDVTRIYNERYPAVTQAASQ